jgi:acyl dehydratase
MPLNFGLAGKVYEPAEVTITAEEIAAYADASGDPNPRHQPGPDQVASLIFPVVPGWEAMGRVGTDPELGVDNPLMILHGEQEFRYHTPIRPGDTLTITPILDSVEDKGKGATYVSKFTATRPDGELVVEGLATIFVRGAGSGAEREKSPPKAAPSRGSERATFTSHVDVGMPQVYATASGDHNPIHLDDEVAKAIGLPGVINHGLGTLSLVAGGLCRELAAGDPAAISGLRVRFTDMVFPGSDLDTTVWESDSPGTYLFETTRPDGSAVMTGALDIA